MQTEPLTLTIAGQTHHTWDMYHVDSNLLTPADAWEVRTPAPDGIRPDLIQPGAPIQITIGPDALLTGRIDRITDKTSRTGKPLLALHGRDLAAVLVDCAAPIYSGNLVSLSDIVANVVKPLGLTAIRIDHKGSLREKVNIEPGDTAWQALQNAAEANGIWPWIEPDGTLVLGGPRYDLPPVATLICRADEPEKNNVMAIELTQDITQSFSQITVLGQSHTGHGRPAESNIKAVFADPTIPYHRPKIIIDHEVTNQAQAAIRAKKAQQDSRLKSFDLKITVSGHRISAPGQPGHGQLWQPGQRVHLISPRHAIDAPYFLMARQCSGGRNQPTITVLTFKEDGIWVPQVHAHKTRRQRQKKGPGQAQIIDLSGSQN